MSKLYQVSRAGTRVLYKLRHHKGHGIHSPFVFSLINDVIEEKLPYYAYEDIHRFLSKLGKISDKKIKQSKLLFRLVARFNPNTMLVIGAGDDISLLYLTAASTQIVCNCLGLSSDTVDIYKRWHRNIQALEDVNQIPLEAHDFIYLDLNYMEDLVPDVLNLIHDKSVVVINGIRTNRKNRNYWKKIIADNTVIISLDLYQLGILFFDKKYFKQNYKLSF